MKTKKVVRKIFDTLNYSKKLKISSILPDRDSDYAILLELEDGSKFEIIIIPTLKRQCITLNPLNQPCYPESPLLHLRIMPIFHNLQLVYNDRN